MLGGYFCKLLMVLISNKKKEFFEYIHDHPIIVYNLIKHIYSRSVCDVLVRLLNTNEGGNAFEEQLDVNLDEIRMNSITKVLEKMLPSA